MKEKLHTCGWKYCKHTPSEPQPESELVKVGKAWFHPDCAQIRKAMTDIKDLYYEQVDKAVVMKQLVSVIKNILIVKEIPPDFAMFALQYAIKNHIPIRSPYSLHYLVSDYKIRKEWERIQAQKKIHAAKEHRKLHTVTFLSPEEDPSNEKYTNEKHGFGSIFGP